MEREIELKFDIKKVVKKKNTARTLEGRQAYDILEYILTKWKEQAENGI